MPFLFTDQSRAGVPIAYNFMYGGNAVTWGTSKITNMSGVSVNAEPFDGKFSVSELSVSFSDTDGSIWGSLGNGTLALGSSWQATVYVGGTMAEQAYGANATRLARLNTGNAATYVIHKGRITSLTRAHRIVTIQSESAMKQLSEMEWRFPVGTDVYHPPITIGTDFFFSGLNPSSLPNALFNHESNKTKFDAYAFVGPNNATLAVHYPTIAGRGTMGRLAGFHYPGTQFYEDYDRFFFKGSYMATFIGTIDDDDKAHSFGYDNLSVAEGSKVPTGPTGSTYNVNRTRYTLSGDSPTLYKGSHWFFQQGQFELEATPATLWRELLTGCCSEPLFTSASDIEALTFAAAVRDTAFQAYSQRIDPAGGKVLPYIKDLLEPIQALFSMDTDNKFRFHTYGAKTLAEVLATITGSSIVDSSLSLDRSMKFNRVHLEYSFNPDNGSFSKRIEVKGSGWSYSNDFPLQLQSKWLTNDNDAAITAQRLVKRYHVGISRLKLKTPLNMLGADVGSLYAVDDSDTGLSSRIFEVIGWNKDYCNSRMVSLELLDGDALYRSKGYARWEGDADMAKVVSGTSTSGWGTLGTVNNINQAFYGSVFVWW